MQSTNIIAGFVANCISPRKSEVFANGSFPRAFVIECRVKAEKDSQEISRTSNDQLFIGSSNVVLTAAVRIRALKNVLFSCIACDEGFNLETVSPLPEGPPRS